MDIRISLNNALIKQVLSSKQRISFFIFIKLMELKDGAEVTMNMGPR